MNMKYREFLKDKIPDIAIVFILCIISSAVLLCFDVDLHAIIMIVFLIIIAFSINLFLDIRKRKKFLDSLYRNSHNIDKAYLVLETISEPEYTEGRYLYELLLYINSSMAEEVKTVRNDFAGFRDYLELWVHEVKLPLSAMNLKIRNLIQQELNDGNDDSADRIAAYRKLLSEISVTQGYLEQIMYYSRLEVSSKDYHLASISANDLIRDAAIKNREMVSDKGASLEVIPLEEDIKIITDDKWLIFIIGQLVANSLKYMMDDKLVITLKASNPSSDLFEIKVRDNGIGIPAGDLDKVFEKSFTGENGRHHSESTGMGLYIVKTLCDRLGHRVSIDSVKGEWTEVTISIGINDYLDTATG